MNVIETMKDTISTANTAMLELKKEMEANKAKYSPFVAEAENAKLRVRADEITSAARKSIEATYSAAAKDIDKWTQLDGTQVTDDVRLLSGAFDLNAGDVARLLIKHQGNPTMTNAVLRYANEHKIPHLCPSEETRRACLDELHEAALGRVNRIDTECGVDPFYVDQWPGMGFMDAAKDRCFNGLNESNMTIDTGEGDGE